MLRFGPRLYFQHDKGFDYDDDDEDDEQEDDISGDDVDSAVKYASVLDETVPHDQPKTESAGVAHRHNYEMHHMGSSSNMTSLKADTTNYGSTDIEQDTVSVAQLLHQNQQHQIERIRRQLGDVEAPNNSFLSWLTKLWPGSQERQQPPNPYQEINRDREVIKLMKKKKSMNKMKSTPSFCT